MDDKFKTMLQIKREREAARHTKYKQSSHGRLCKIASKKIKTTMIGSLDSIERHFGFMWTLDESGGLSDEAKYMKELYEKVREEILDNGNNQARNLQTELEQYDVEWLRYHMLLPVKPISGQQGDEDGKSRGS